ncbi:MAG: phosphotransferase [Fuscovulum sp.]|nr:phosphotransferase [Fuscovulum sp.]
MPVEIRPLSRSALLVDERVIVKHEPRSPGWLRRLYRVAMGGSLPFQNEIQIYRANPQHFPEIATVDRPGLILIPFEASVRGVGAEDVDMAFVTRIFTDLSSLRGHTGFGPVKRLLFRLLNAPVPRTLRDLRRSRKLTVPERLRLAWRLICLQARQPKLNAQGQWPVIHNDLMLHNILRFPDRTTAIDFEDALVERRWVFADVTDLMFQGNHWTPGEMAPALRALSLARGDGWSDRNLQDHLTYGLLRFHIRRTVMSRVSEAERSESLRQIREWLHGPE